MSDNKEIQHTPPKKFPIPISSKRMIQRSKNLNINQELFGLYFSINAKKKFSFC